MKNTLLAVWEHVADMLHGILGEIDRVLAQAERLETHSIRLAHRVGNAAKRPCFWPLFIVGVSTVLAMVL